LEPEIKTASPLQICLWLLGLLGILSASAFLTSKRHKPCQPIRPENTSGNKCTGIPTIAPDTKADAIPTDYCKYEPDGGKNTTPWWKPAAAIAQVVIALITLGLLVVNVFQMRATTNAANAAVDEANTTKRQLELAQRPWVYTDIEITKPLTFGSDGAQMEIKTKSRNEGNTPAVGVYVRSEMVIGPKPGSIADERARFCDENVQRGGRAQGITLIPKDTPKEAISHGD
jgi:hypothetical protein